MNCIVDEIIDMEFGCEGRPDDMKGKVFVRLRMPEGNKKLIRYDDEELFKKNIHEGNLVEFDGNTLIKKPYKKAVGDTF
ncbi:MAG: hypothetical protein IIT65_03830 [Lachnospiraceae bacterium]|nr:hypothetical protein [Lachnospiraceae bacterium]